MPVADAGNYHRMPLGQARSITFGTLQITLNQHTAIFEEIVDGLTEHPAGLVAGLVIWGGEGREAAGPPRGCSSRRGSR